MNEAVELFAGFPLPLSDYAPLVDALSVPGRLTTPIRVAHSLGSLPALSTPSDRPTILLAPSIPGPRPGRAAIRLALTIASHSPGELALAKRLRNASYRRYGAVPPVGAPLSLAEAAQRLRAIRSQEPRMPPLLIVLTSKDDPRHEAQEELADQWGLATRSVDGGHMFPITHPAETAREIFAALSP